MVYGGSGTEQMCFLGIEDLWGNASQWIDGVEIRNSNVYIDLTNTFKSYTTNVGKEARCNYIRNMSKTATSLYLALPNGGGGSESTHYCDISYHYGKNFVHGGYYSLKEQSGIFFQKAHDYSCNLETARLVYLGE